MKASDCLARMRSRFNATTAKRTERERGHRQVEDVKSKTPDRDVHVSSVLENTLIHTTPPSLGISTVQSSYDDGHTVIIPDLKKLPVKWQENECTKRDALQDTPPRGLSTLGSLLAFLNKSILL